MYIGVMCGVEIIGRNIIRKAGVSPRTSECEQERHGDTQDTLFN